MQRGVTQHIIHSRPLPLHSLVTLPDCSRSSIWLKKETSERLKDERTQTPQRSVSCAVQPRLIQKLFVFLNLHFSVQSQAPFHWYVREIAGLFEPINQAAFVEKDEAYSHLFYSQDPI